MEKRRQKILARCVKCELRKIMKECSRCSYQSCNEAEIVPLLPPLSGEPNRDILLLLPLSKEPNRDLLLLPPLSSEQREVLEATLPKLGQLNL